MSHKGAHKQQRIFFTQYNSTGLKVKSKLFSELPTNESKLQQDFLLRYSIKLVSGFLMRSLKNNIQKKLNLIQVRERDKIGIVWRPDKFLEDSQTFVSLLYLHHVPQAQETFTPIETLLYTPVGVQSFMIMAQTKSPTSKTSFLLHLSVEALHQMLLTLMHFYLLIIHQ